MVVVMIGNFPVCAIQEERRQDRVYKAVKIDIKSGFANERGMPFKSLVELRNRSGEVLRISLPGL
jgi:hypothetical protein